MLWERLVEWIILFHKLYEEQTLLSFQLIYYCLECAMAL